MHCCQLIDERMSIKKTWGGGLPVKVACIFALLPALYFGGTYIRAAVNAKTLESVPVKPLSLAEAQILYEKASQADQCLFMIENRMAEEAFAKKTGIAFSAQDLKDQGEAEALICQGRQYSHAQVNAWMEQAARAGVKKAEYFLLIGKLRDLERLRAPQPGMVQKPLTAEERGLISKLQQLAFIKGNKEAMNDLSSVYLNGVLAPADAVTALALQVVAENPDDVLQIDKFNWPPMITAAQKAEVFAKAQEIQKRCCSKG